MIEKPPADEWYVASSGGRAIWHLTVAADATSGEDALGEVFDIAETLRAGFADFVMPRSLRYTPGTVPAGRSCADARRDLETDDERTIERPDGVDRATVESLADTPDAPAGRTGCLYAVRFRDPAVTLTVDGEPVTVGPDDERYRLVIRDELSDRRPLYAPVTFGVTWSGPTSISDPGTPCLYDVRVTTPSPAFAWDDPDGERNRERLGAAFDTLRADLPVADAWLDIDEMPIGIPSVRRLAGLADARIEDEF